MVDRFVTTGESDWRATYQSSPSASTVEKRLAAQGAREPGETLPSTRGRTSCRARP